MSDAGLHPDGKLPPKLCFIGFGEAGQAFAGGLMQAGIREVAAFDIAGHEARICVPAERLGVRLAADPATALEGADYVFSAVTAESSLDAARRVAPLLGPHQLFVDVNSVSPGRKRAAAAAIGRPGGYLDLAIMAPVHPRQHQTPCLAAGPSAESFVAVFGDYGMNLSVAGPEIGAATQVKMVRSVMVKGLEALCYECFAAARSAGIEADILASLQRSYPGIAWRDVASYNVSRMLDHGVRRAAEMREVALTLRELGVEPAVTEGTVAQQERLGRLALETYPPDLEEMLDLVRRELKDANVLA
ncbi:NAD(P)-dependent oxidoreductase [Ancylobacter defluvii]|nr:NAD(P)-dependent oxidoreductase [Ancylobacter defluvii]